MSLFPIILSSSLTQIVTTSLIYQLIVGIMFLLQILLIFSYFFIKTRRIGDLRLFIFAIAFSSSQIITLLISSRIFSIDILDVINILVRFLSVFIYIFIPSKLNISKESFNKFMKYFVILSLVASMYNIIINFSALPSLFAVNNPYSLVFSSFYFNRNAYAQFLLFSIIANTFLWIEKQTKFSFFIYIMLLINIFLTLSRTVIGLTILYFIIIYFFYFRKKKSNRITFLLLIIIFVVIVVSNQEIRNFISIMLIRKDVGTSGRTFLWSTGLSILGNTNWIFGTGYFASSNYIQSLGYNLTEFHSFYIETLVGGGAIDLFMHLLIFYYAFKNVIFIFKYDKNNGMIYFASYIVFAIYGVVESASFFTMGYVGTLFTIFLLTIPLLYSNNLRMKAIVNKNSDDNSSNL